MELIVFLVRLFFCPNANCSGNDGKSWQLVSETVKMFENKVLKKLDGENKKLRCYLFY